VSEPSPDLVRRVLKLAERYGLSELEVELDGVRVGVVTDPDAATTTAGLVPPAGAPAAPIYEEDPDVELITAPITGTFYRSPSPNTPPFIEPGAVIETGQTIGIIEAMKVFNEVPSPLAGEVLEIPAPDGYLVQRGDPLMVVRRAAREDDGAPE